jgi:hypothetical protein
MRRDIYDLIDLALKLLPEDEGLDFSDQPWDAEDMVDIRDRLGQARKAIDKVGLAIADKFAREVAPVGYSTVVAGGFAATVTETTRKPFWIDKTGEGCATWLQGESVEVVAKLISTESRDGTRRPRLAGLPQVAKDTFIDWIPESANPTLKVYPVEQGAQWLARLRVGEVGRYARSAPNRIEYLEGTDDPDRSDPRG